MKNFLFSAALVAALFSSCVTAPTVTATRSADSKILGVGMSIQSINTAELKVSDTRETFVYTTESTETNFKSNATYDFLEKYGADVIVEPRYEITYLGTQVTVKITGRPATITNVKQVELKDCKK